MTRPRLLDLYSGAGGCSVGFHRAGFDVTGVDITPHPDYPFELIVDDAMNWVTDPYRLNQFDVVAGSPPCPRFSSITPTHTRNDHPDHLTPTLAALRAWGGMWVVENVPRAPLPGAVTYCGKAMGLPHLRRHRLFASSVFLMSPGCACDRGPAFGVYGDHGDLTPVRRTNGTSRGNKARDVTHAQQIMGIDWMTHWDDLADAIPPAYTEHIGGQLLAALDAAA
jgi:DNA (cytosine-5)-methyltransferase 1